MYDEWNHYIATPPRAQKPVKIDAILEQRLRSFLRNRHKQLARETK